MRFSAEYFTFTVSEYLRISYNPFRIKTGVQTISAMGRRQRVPSKYLFSACAAPDFFRGDPGSPEREQTPPEKPDPAPTRRSLARCYFAIDPTTGRSEHSGLASQGTRLPVVPSQLQEPQPKSYGYARATMTRQSTSRARERRGETAGKTKASEESLSGIKQRRASLAKAQKKGGRLLALPLRGNNVTERRP